MEQTVPGLTELQFALTRRRVTAADGALDGLGEIRPGEFSYEDAWNRPYVGRSYAADFPTLSPDRVPHELFQTGVQDVFDRPSNRFGDHESQGLVLGALALL